MFIRTENGSVVSFGNMLYLGEDGIYMSFPGETVCLYTTDINPEVVFDWLVRRVGKSKNTDLRFIKAISDLIVQDKVLIEKVKENPRLYRQFLEFAYGRKVTPVLLRNYFMR